MSGYTTGKIRTVSTTTIITLTDGRIAYFQEQIASTLMDKSGDSGSMVLNKKNEILGMIMGGSEEFTLINEIKYIQKLLNIDVFTQI